MILNVILSALAALIPTVAYVVLLWRLDRFEKEPLMLFAAAFIWGALPAVMASLVAEVASTAPLDNLLGQWSTLVSLGVFAPFVEETFKCLALLLLFWFFRSEFDGVLDGVIYGSVIGFGFAMTENLLYFINAWPGPGVGGWASLVFVRVAVFGLNHAMYTALAGAALGYARLRRDVRARWGIYLLGFLAAVLAHMLHNILVAGLQVCVLGFILDWLGVAALLATIVLSWRNERSIVKTYLLDEVHLGTISQAHYERIVANTLAVGSKRAGMGSKSAAEMKSWKDYQQTATRLAFKKYEQAKVGEEGCNSHLIAGLREKLAYLNSRITT
ncbi:MAG: PrsW family intramembrane metalloprotease [Anaerolineae bacterium]